MTCVKNAGRVKHSNIAKYRLNERNKGLYVSNINIIMSIIYAYGQLSALPVIVSEF